MHRVCRSRRRQACRGVEYPRSKYQIQRISVAIVVVVKMASQGKLPVEVSNYFNFISKSFISKIMRNSPLIRHSDIEIFFIHAIHWSKFSMIYDFLIFIEFQICHLKFIKSNITWNDGYSNEYWRANVKFSYKRIGIYWTTPSCDATRNVCGR